MGQRLSIFTLCENLPTPDRSAGCRRYFAVLEHLARAHRVDLFVANVRGEALDEAGYRARLEAVGVNVLRTDRRGWLAGCLRRRRYDLGWYEFWHQASAYGPAFRQHQPWAKLVVDTVDVHYAREQAAATLGLMDPQVAAANRERELATYRAADAVVVVTEDDRHTLAAAGSVPAVSVIPLIIPARNRPAGPRPPGVLFVGGFGHAPNADGILWFAREVWPAVRRRMPATLTVVGASPPPEVTALDGRDGVTVTGHVPDIGPHLDRAAVSVAPLRYGAGMKGKVTEAMAAGLPVVTTSVGGQGLGLTSGEHAVVADDQEAFAAAVASLLADQAAAERLGAAGRRLMDGLCSPTAVGRQLDVLLERLVRTPTRPPLKWRLLSAQAVLITLTHDLIVRPAGRGR